MACLGQGQFHDVDEDSANLIIRLQLQDAELYASSSKGEGREDEFNDESLAFQLQQQELQNVDLYFSDRRMAQRISNVVQPNRPTVMGATLQGTTASRGLELPHDPQGNAEFPNANNPITNSGLQQLDDESISQFRALSISGSAGLDDDIYEAESFTSAVSRSPSIAPDTTHCEACGDEKNSVDVGQAPCDHEYCRDCLQDLFKTAITDESLFPPRCCRQPIPLETVQMFLTSEITEYFTNKKVEFDTPNKTYCSVKTCSAFIGSGNISHDVGTCHQCGSTTCTLCKAEAHDRGDCPNDTALQQTLDTAKENGWQRCNSCSSVVELNHGCNHITCRCGSQFCYLCGVAWKNCDCAQWDEGRLLARANQIADRQQGAQQLPQADRAALVARTAQNIRRNHRCIWHYWHSVKGAHRCEECRHALSQFIYECERCEIRVCRRCKNNMQLEYMS